MPFPRDPRLDTWAEALVGYSVEVKPGQTVAILGGVPAEPLLRAIYRKVIDRGGSPVLLPAFSGLLADLLIHGSDAQIEYVSPVERFIRGEADVVVNVIAETNTKNLSAVDPARQRHYARARSDLMEAFMRREATGELEWTITLYPTDAYAQDAEMATADFAEFVFAACKLGEPDPVAAWRDLATEQQRLIDWLAGKRELHVVGPDTDLTLSVAGRTWINADGRKNFPDGEIFTGPVEDSANGVVRFSFPAIAGGREVEDIRLRFENGKVVEATAAKNEAYLTQTLDTDTGSRTLGEFAIGTNFSITRFTKNTLFDEKIGGTVHMAVGSGYLPSGSRNQSAVHWDMVCDLRQGGRIDVDGQPFLRDGKFVV